MKIIKHSFCKRKDCSFIGKTGVIESEMPPVVGKGKEQVYWVRLENGVLAKFKESDLEE